MAQFTIQNNSSGKLFVPSPVNRVLDPGEQITRDLTTADMESAEIIDLTSRQLIIVSSANSPNIRDEVETPTFEAVETDHDDYDYLGHLLAETNYEEPTYDVNGDVSSIISWTTAGKTEKVRESTFTRDGDGVVQTSVTIQYTAGVETSRLTETYAYNPDGSLASVSTVRT